MRNSPHRYPILNALAIAVAIASCGGGGGGSDNSINAPPTTQAVASVSVSPTSANIVPLETNQLSALVKDVSGATVTRTVSWSSGNAAVATVSNTGLVSAVAPGQSVITATSEGKSGTATIVVAEGGAVSANRGTVVAANSAIKLVFPAGAVASNFPVQVNVLTDAVADPAGYWLSSGARYQLGPNGSQFAQPVAVTIRYDQNDIPPWALASDLTIQRFNGTTWQPLTGIVVDPVQHTVTGQTTGFSTFAIATNLPKATLTPGQGSVNAAQRSVAFAATLPGHASNSLQYVWATTGANGTIGVQVDNTIQYTATSVIFPAGELDWVGVELRGRRVANGPFVAIASAVTSVKADLQFTLELQPSTQIVQYSGSSPVTAQVFDRGLPYQNPELYYEWTATQNAGSVALGAARTQTKVNTYTAFPASQQSSVFPKGDKITVKALVHAVQTKGSWEAATGRVTTQVVGETFTEIGTVDAFVEVMPRYQVKLLPVSTDLPGGGQQVTLSVQLDPVWQGTESLSLRWRNTSNYGDLSVPLNTLTDKTSVTYTARPTIGGGSDLIDVDVNVGVIPRFLLGTAQATVQVGPRTTAMWRLVSATVTKAGILNDPNVDMLYYNYVANGMTALAASPGDNFIFVNAGEAGLQQVPAGQGPTVRGLIDPPRATFYGLADKERVTIGALGAGVLSGEFWIGTDSLDPLFHAMTNSINATMTPGILQGSFTVQAWKGVVYTVTFRAVQIVP